MKDHKFKNRVFCKFCSDEILWEKKLNQWGAVYWNPLNKGDRGNHRCKSQVWESSLDFKKEFGIQVEQEDRLLNYWYLTINDIADLMLGRRVYLEKEFNKRTLSITLMRRK